MNNNNFVARAYNSFEIDQRTKSIVFKSSKEKRLSDEIDYYKNLPIQLQPFFPRYFNTFQSENLNQIALEYYAYSNLGEKMINEDNDSNFWNKTFDFIFNYIDFYKYNTKIDGNFEDIKLMLINKTETEYEKLFTDFEFFKDIRKYDELIFNGKKLLSFDIIWSKIKTYIDNNFKSDDFYFIHGDFCFSNILYGINNINDDVILKFIDPRGSFGNTKFYGDCYYDLAKLSHSCSGGYEYIINDKFTIDNENNKFSLIYKDFRNISIYYIFLEYVNKHNFDINKIKLIEGTIFIGMCARHYDSLDRQKVMYLTGLNILNDIYNNLI